MCSIPISRDPGTARRGFTLIEMLVALTISGLVVGVIFQLLQGNSRFVRLQAAREEVQQNGRAAVGLIASELRGIPRGAIVTLGESAIEFRLPRGWGILCNPVTTATGTAWVLFPDGTMPDDFQPAAQNWGIAVEQTSDPAVNTGAWRFVAGVGGPGTADPCDALAAAGPHQRAGFSSGTPLVSGGVTAQPGTMVLVYERMRYDVEEAPAGANVPGSWIRRAVGWNAATNSLNMQPMAGPVPGQAGLRFTYFRDDGVTETANANEVRLVRIRVVMESRAQSARNGVRRPEQVDTVTTDVFVRN